MTKERLIKSNKKGHDDYSCYELRLEKKERTPETANYKETKILIIGGYSATCVDQNVAKEEGLHIETTASFDYDDIFKKNKLASTSRSYDLKLKAFPKEGESIIFATKRIYPHQEDYDGNSAPAEYHFREWEISHNLHITWNVFKDDNLDEFMERLENEKFDAWVEGGVSYLPIGKGIHGRNVYEYLFTDEKMKLTQQYITRLIHEVNSFNHLRNEDLFDIIP